MKGLADVQSRNIHFYRFRKCAGRTLHFNVAEHMLQGAATGLHAHGLAHGHSRQSHDHALIGLHFPEIYMERLAAHGVVLHFLHQGQAGAVANF